jgi:hypothetical protein
MQTAQDARDRAKTRIATLAKRVGDATLTPSPSDDDQLDGYVSDALKAIAKKTDRLTATLSLQTVAGQAYIDEPEHVDVIQEAQVFDSGAGHELHLESGGEMARRAQAPDASEGRPHTIGAHGQRLWLFPVPDATYDLMLHVSQSGASTDSPQPSDDTVPPGLDALVAQMPAELDRALVGYVAAEWMVDSGEPEAAERDRARFVRDLERHDTDPNRKRTTTRPYNPLGM